MKDLDEFHYLQVSLENGLWFLPTSFSTLVVGYSDADWAGYRDSCHSTIRYAVFLGPNLIAWCFKKQPTVSKSSTEADYRAIGYTVVETIKIHKLLFNLGVTFFTPVCLYCNNLSATYMSVNSVQHDHSKHTAMDCHFVRELMEI